MTDRGLSDKVKGKAKESVGKVTDDKVKQAEGLADQAVGKAKEVAADVKDKAEKAVDKLKD